MLTAYGATDDNGLVNETRAHFLLGGAMRVLHDYTVITDGLMTVNSPPTQILDSNLRGEFEHIKICLDPISLEDLSKVWTALTRPYRLSAAYTVSVVQIESRRIKTLAAPVLTRRIHLAISKRPQISNVYRTPVLPGETIGDIRAHVLQELTIEGENFRAAQTWVKLGDLEPIGIQPASDREIRIVVPDDTYPADADHSLARPIPPADQLRPGSQTVEVQILRPAEVVEGGLDRGVVGVDDRRQSSNHFVFLLAPEISGINPPSVDEESRFHQEDAESCAITRALEAVEADLTSRRQDLTEAGGIPSLEALARSFGLSPFERDAVLLCFAVDEDPEFATLCAYLQDDVNARCALLHLVLSMLCQTREQRELARATLLPSAPLRRFRLLTFGEGSAGQSSRSLRIDERLADYVRGINRLDESVVHLLRPAPLMSIGGVHRTLVDQLVRWAESAAGQPWPPFHLTGPASAGKKAIASEFCARAGLQLYSIDLRHLPLQDAERHQLLHVMEREAVLSRFALYVDTADFDLADRLLSATARDWIERYGGVLFIGGRERWQFQRQALHIAVPKLDATEQRELWARSLEGIANSVDGQIHAIVQQFDLGPGAIPQAVSSAIAKARSRPGDFMLAAEDLWRACREQVGWQLGSLAQRLTPCYTWDDIVLPDDLRRQLREIADQVAARSQVYESWGFGARLPRGRGINALFSGPSGTGKTMAAEILANDLQLDLYRIDLAGVVSKYIGETEKNLRNVFDVAEQSGAILFFDEADALFGKRSEVKDSHDRYANIEVNYLLQRMEDYRGLAILCTNRRSALDRAFLRRLRFLVELPFPDCENRRSIWQKVFPAQAPLAPLDLAALSRLEISGGNIRNIALNAAFLAAGQGSNIRMEHVLHAARREYAKIDKMLTEAEFGSHLRLMKT